jgi:hypothetical protein
MLTRMPVAGVAWVTISYLLGFQRLGCDVYYVEQHARTPGELMETGESGDGADKAAAYIARILGSVDLGDRWAYQALNSDGVLYGMSQSAVSQLFRRADLIVNLHGSAVISAEQSATGRLVYIGTDPVQVEIELYNNVQRTIEYLAPHAAFFTWGSNYGHPDCKLPISDRFHLVPTLPPVIMDFWNEQKQGPGPFFTTIGNWRQDDRPIEFEGEVYHWSKHLEFLKFLDLPHRTDQTFELALSHCHPSARERLQRKGWLVRDGLEVSRDPDTYRAYIARSRGEFTVAKDQNVRLRSGWFSERSASYLAAGRPVITQETGFSNVLPSGEGLFGFLTMDEILAAVEAINSDYERNSRTAREIARDYFSYDVVLPPILDAVGLPARPRATSLPIHRGE